MLKQLVIRNYALIKSLEIQPSEGLNMVTGETGAGKSIMLGALGLLKGDRADTKALFDQEKKCIVEGTFEVGVYHLEPIFEELELDYDPVSIIRREIAPSGKSRAFINDSPVTLDALRKITASLMDVHSQHDTLLLGSQDFQLTLLDGYLQNQGLLLTYREEYQAFRKAEKKLNQLKDELAANQKEFDFNNHQLTELSEAKLEEIDQDALEKELEKHENAEAIKSGLNEVMEYLSRAEFAAETMVKSAVQSLGQIGKFDEAFEQMKERANSCLIELMDIVYEAEKQESELSHDFEREQWVREKLDALYSLQKKHRIESVEELIQLRDELQEKVDRVVNFDQELEEAEKRFQQAKKKMQLAAQHLSENRQAGIPKISEAINQLLAGLGMPNGQLSIEKTAVEPTSSGTDEITFLFSANKGISPKPLKSVASGGEFSRLMLAVKYILASKTALPTIVFDEIDTGISGEVAMKVGNIMTEMARHHQVIVISHLPQIAALGKQHYYVFKDHSEEKTVSRIKLLTTEERVQEIAQMIGGSAPSESAFQSARELMGETGKSKMK